MEQLKRVVKKPLSMLKQEEDCGWDDDDDGGGGLGKLVVADSYDGQGEGDGDGDDKDVDEDAPSSREIVDYMNPDDYPQLAMFLRLNYLDEELQKNWMVIGKDNAAMLQQQWIQIMTKQMNLAADKMDIVEDIFLLIHDRKKLKNL